MVFRRAAGTDPFQTLARLFLLGQPESTDDITPACLDAVRKLLAAGFRTGPFVPQPMA